MPLFFSTMKTFNQHITEALTLEYHDELNEKVWDGEKMRPNIRAKLLEIAEVWKEFANIPEEAVHDILFTGGNANFNYTSASDLDVHILTDFDKMSCDRELVEDFFKTKKALWGKTHNITVVGFPVELYAQPIEEESHVGQGVFSLMNDRWIQLPTNQHLNFRDDPALQRKVDYYIDLINNVVDGKEDRTTAQDLKLKIASMRGAAIQRAGEFSFENLVFKELRNQGYLDKLSAYLLNIKDKALSLA